MGCSATKTVPQECQTPAKGQANGRILTSQKHADVDRKTPGAQTDRSTPETAGQNGGRPAGQTGGQTEERTGSQPSDPSGGQAQVSRRKMTPSDSSLPKDLGLRKLQRKETPHAGPLAQNNKAISQSQMEFFKLLDEKIEKGGELEDSDQVT